MNEEEEKPKKKKNYNRNRISRANLIVVAITFFCCIVIVFAGLCLDGGNGIVVANNPIASIVTSLGMPAISAEYNGWAIVWLFIAYLLIGEIAVIFEMGLRKYSDYNHTQKRWNYIYGGTIGGAIALWIVFSVVANLYENHDMANSFIFFGETLLVGHVICIIIAALVVSVLSLYVNFHNIDKPFRAFGRKGDEQMLAEEEEAKKQEEAAKAANSLADILGTGKNNGESGINIPGLGNGEGNENAGHGKMELGTKEYVFPGLTTIDDEALKTGEIEIRETQVTLNSFTEGLRNYLASKQYIYFDRRTVRQFVAGLASSRLIILEGLSGTGKSSLARYFSTYIGEESYFAAVQASWRDRSSILGFYNDFSKSYSETDFLKRLYEKTYQPSHMNVMVLDEVNISRVEYYFADFLSVLEYPQDKWQLRIMELPYGFEPPMHLDDGILTIPSNTWFIGTANKDDSTYTITDKVYDRAITISFGDRTEPFTPEVDQEPISISAKALNALFDQAKATDAYRYDTQDHKKFTKLTDYVSSHFGVAFGNRVLNQIISFVPVYVACGGKKEEALDFIFASKILSKLEGRFEEYVKTGLIELRQIVLQTYGAKDFMMSIKAIDELLRKL